MSSEVSAALQGIARRMAEANAQFEQVRGEVTAEMDKVAKEFQPMTPEQEEELTKSYRSGAAGPELRDLQGRVDRGEVTWEAIKSGTAEPELVAKYIRSQAKLGQLVTAAAAGKDMDKFFEEQHRLGNHFAATAPAAAPMVPPAPPVRRPPRPRTDGDDEDFSNRSWLRDDE
ncbi:MAG TPA: hypothetical protein VHZ97_15350 [Pseudonocardiaceae bacterium]|jgi:hypothetical protein|nr:hypothetical protein [Pseudonocardiaceae bacterium]